MEDCPKDWVRHVLLPAMLYGAIGGIAFGGLVIWIFSEPNWKWQDYVGIPILSAMFGSLLAWMTTGLAGIVRYLCNR